MNAAAPRLSDWIREETPAGPEWIRYELDLDGRRVCAVAEVARTTGSFSERGCWRWYVHLDDFEGRSTGRVLTPATARREADRTLSQAGLPEAFVE
jgi:hypothetical protein